MKLVERDKVILNTNIVGIFINIFLFIFKFLIGTITKSVSIVADSYNNLSDSLSNIISIVGSKLSLKPADKEHPFGHGRIEYITAFIVAFLVFQVGIYSLISAIRKIFEKEELVYDNRAVIILIISILFKIFLHFFYKKIGNKIKSDILLAMSLDSFSDIFITFGTLITLIIFKIFNLNIDILAGIIISLIIIYNSILILKETIEPLVGKSANLNLCKDITDFVKNYDKEIINTHDLIVNNYGIGKYMCSIHVEVDKNKDIEYLHEIIDNIESDIKNKMGILLVIHLDPVDMNNENIKEYKKIINDEIAHLEKEYNISGTTFHDFRCVQGIKNTNVIFDIVLPWEIKNNEVDNFINKLKANVNKVNSNLTLVVNVDRKM